MPSPLTRLVTAIRKRLTTTASTAESRRIAAELERYDRAIVGWVTIPPTDDQLAAMLEQLLALEARTEMLAKSSPRTTTQKMAKAPPIPTRLASTTSMKRAASERPPGSNGARSNRPPKATR